MSIQFNDTSNFKGLVQLYEKETGQNQGDVSNSTTKLKAFAADANIALDYLWNIGLRSDGGWQIDDTNHTDFPERTMTLTSGTRRYLLHSFTADAGTNLMLEVQKVFVKDPTGVYQEMERVNVQGQLDETSSFTDGQALSGTPYRYDATGGYIDLDPVPDYTLAPGIKVLIKREPAYFASTDTTKKAGIHGSLHPYLYLKPAYDYARRNNMPTTNELLRQVKEMEQVIEDTFMRRGWGDRNIIQNTPIEYM